MQPFGNNHHFISFSILTICQSIVRNNNMQLFCMHKLHMKMWGGRGKARTRGKLNLPNIQLKELATISHLNLMNGLKYWVFAFYYIKHYNSATTFALTVQHNIYIKEIILSVKLFFKQLKGFMQIVSLFICIGENCNV